MGGWGHRIPTPPLLSLLASSHSRGWGSTDLWGRARGGQDGLDPGSHGRSPGTRSGQRHGHATWSAPETTQPGPPGLGAEPLAESVSWEHKTRCQFPIDQDKSCPKLLPGQHQLGTFGSILPQLLFIRPLVLDSHRYSAPLSVPQNSP